MQKQTNEVLSTSVLKQASFAQLKAQSEYLDLC